MVVSLLLIFLATAWIIYVYLDRYKYFRGLDPESGIGGDAGTVIKRPQSPASHTSHRILGKSRSESIRSNRPASVTPDPLMNEELDSQVLSDGAEYNGESQHIEHDSNRDEEDGEDNNGDDSDEDIYGPTGEVEEETHHAILDLPLQVQNQNDHEGEDSEDETGHEDLPIVNDLTDTVRLIRGDVLLSESGTAALFSPSLGTMLTTNRLASVGVADQREDDVVIEASDDDGVFTEYALDDIMAQVENQVVATLDTAAPHYQYRDLPLSEYIAEFRAIRQGALLLKRELARSGNTGSIDRMATDYVRYIGEKGFSGDSNVIESIGTALLANIPLYDSADSDGENEPTDQYVDLFTRLEHAVSTGQDLT